MLLLIKICTATPVQPSHLTGMVNAITGDDGFLTLRFDVHADMAWCVTECRREINLVGQPMIKINKVHKPGVKYRLYRVTDNIAVAAV